MLSLIQTVALVGGTVHFMTPGVEPAVATVLIEEGRIVAVGADLEVPEDAEVLDLRGLHVAPGLIDASVHHDPEHDLLYLMAGVTTVRDAGNDLEAVLTQSLPPNRELGPGPDLLVAGKALDGPQGSLSGALSLADATEAQQKLGFLLHQVAEVDQVLRDGGQDGCGLAWLTFLGGLPEPAWRSTLAVATEAGIPVWGPRLPGLTLAQVAEAGQAGIVGLQSLLPDGTRLDQLDPASLPGAVDAAAAAGLPVVPMLGVWARMLVERSPDLPELNLLSPHYSVSWRDELEAWRRDLNPQAESGRATREAIRQGLARQQELLLALHGAGVPLVPGTASPNPWLLPGRSLVEELELWAAAGLPPADVLRLATAGAARALGLGDEIGQVAEGYRANLVVLGSDPRQSVSALRGPEIVVIRGRVLELPELEDGLQALARHQTELRAEFDVPLDVPPPDRPEGEVLLSGALEYEAHGVRLSAERWCVVDCPDGKRAFCARIRTQRSAGEGSRELQVIQFLQDGKLESFDVRVRDWVEPQPAVDGEAADGDADADAPDGADPDGADGELPEAADPTDASPDDGVPDDGVLGPEEPAAPETLEREFTVRGRSIGTSGILNIERRRDGIFVDNRRSPQAVGALDLSQGLLGVMVGHHFPSGENYVLSLEGPTLEPAVDRWRMRVVEDSGLIQLQHSRGWAMVGLDETGHPSFLQRRTGNALTGCAFDPAADRGELPPLPARVLRPEEGAAPVEAGAGDGEDGR